MKHKYAKPFFVMAAVFFLITIGGVIAVTVFDATDSTFNATRGLIVSMVLAGIGAVLYFTK